jgi:hypothetical protein
MPALTPMDVWMHRRNGELWRTTLNRLRPFRRRPFPALSAPASTTSFSACLNMSAIRAPSDRAWSHPPYVKGGSYGAAEVCTHLLSATSSRLPCLVAQHVSAAHQPTTRGRRTGAGAMVGKIGRKKKREPHRTTKM